jgi:transcriptional regulator with GAF, ATPase, and Fis domain
VILQENTKYKSVQPSTEMRRSRDTTAIMENRLNALAVLVNSVMFEVDALKNIRNVEEKEQIDFEQEVRTFEADLIRCALMRTGGIQRRAASLLGIKVTTLNTKIKRLGISPNGLTETAFTAEPEAYLSSTLTTKRLPIETEAY